MHVQANQLIEAIKENARQVWTEPEDKEFIEDLLYVKELPNGSTEVSDNFEKFFDIIYRVDKEGNWYIRRMYGERGEDPYTFEKAMADASIMYTG